MPRSEWDPAALSQRAQAAWSDTVSFASHLAGRAGPFVSHAAVSAAAFTATLATAQARRACLAQSRSPSSRAALPQQRAHAFVPFLPRAAPPHPLSQGASFAARVSCATPVLAPVVGFLSVGAASAASGQASAALARWRRDGRGWDAARWKSLVAVDDLVLDALMGAALFVVRVTWQTRGSARQMRLTRGGRCMRARSRRWVGASAACCPATSASWCVLPRARRLAAYFAPLRRCAGQGALARESLPAAGSAYATDVQRAELRMLFRRYGCHHCGKRFGSVIADHQPPNKTVYGAARNCSCFCLFVCQI